MICAQATDSPASRADELLLFRFASGVVTETAAVAQMYPDVVGTTRAIACAVSDGFIAPSGQLIFDGRSPYWAFASTSA